MTPGDPHSTPARPMRESAPMTHFPDRSQVTCDLAARLIREQFPEYAHLPVTDVDHGGWDNRTFRLGDALSIRMPSAPGYVAQVEKEQRWLPRLAPHLPLPIPAPVALGRPTAGYPGPWSINRWLPGEPLATTPVPDQDRLASDLAAFLNALYAIDASEGPPAGEHSFYRGCSPAPYDARTRETIAGLLAGSDAATATAIWERTLTTEWAGTPVWCHGDVAVGNLLINNGRLSAVIDFGTSTVGDPACDTVFAWTWLTGNARRIFADRLAVSPDCWIRGRGWALWKCLITLADTSNTTLPGADEQRRILHEILTDPVAD